MENISEEEAKNALKTIHENSYKISEFCEKNEISTRNTLMAIGCLMGSLSSYLSKDEEQMQFLYLYIGGMKKMYDEIKAKKDD